jgi:hypothetical protein
MRRSLKDASGEVDLRRRKFNNDTNSRNNYNSNKMAMRN